MLRNMLLIKRKGNANFTANYNAKISTGKKTGISMSFRNILLEAYKIIKCEDNDNQNVKNAKLLNYFNFLNSIVRPPSYTKMTLNLCIL